MKLGQQIHIDSPTEFTIGNLEPSPRLRASDVKERVADVMKDLPPTGGEAYVTGMTLNAASRRR